MGTVSDDLLRRAAEMRTAGNSWAQIAEKLNRKLNTVKSWTSIYRQRWLAVLEECQAEFAASAMAESLAALRTLLRHKDEIIRQKAAQGILQSCVRRPSAAKPADQPENTQAGRLAKHVMELSDDEIDALVRDANHPGHGGDPPAGAAGPGECQ